MLHLLIKSKCFQRLFSRISNIPLILYFHIFLLRDNITDDIFFKINVYIYLTVPVCLERDTVVHRCKAYEKKNNLRYNICWNRWLNVEVIAIFLTIFGIIKLTKLQPLPQNALWMNYLVQNHGSFNREKVPSEWSLFKGVKNCTSGECAMVE